MSWGSFLNLDSLIFGPHKGGGNCELVLTKKTKLCPLVPGGGGISTKVVGFFPNCCSDFELQIMTRDHVKTVHEVLQGLAR